MSCTAAAVGAAVGTVVVLEVVDSGVVVVVGVIFHCPMMMMISTSLVLCVDVWGRVEAWKLVCADGIYDKFVFNSDHTRSWQCVAGAF
eukprot:gene13043-14383_t